MYDKRDNLVVIGTFGRGVWTLSNLSASLPADPLIAALPSAPTSQPYDTAKNLVVDSGTLAMSQDLDAAHDFAISDLSVTGIIQDALRKKARRRVGNGLT